MSDGIAKLHPPPSRDISPGNPFPRLLQTPSGLAILELQGTINLPKGADGEPLNDLEIGRIEFPDYDPAAPEDAGAKRCLMYIGQHQRLHGKVVKLPKAIAVVRRRESQHEQSDGGEELEIVEIVKHKLLFSTRPEPVTASTV